MDSLRSLLVLVSIALPNASFAVIRPQQEVLYGDDNRHEVYEVESKTLREFARSTALITHRHRLTTPRPRRALPNDGNGDIFNLRTVNYGVAMNLCEKERFYSEPVGGHCSSFLIAKSTMITAGHCIPTEFECQNSAFVFDYAYTTEADQPQIVKRSNVYNCKRIIGQELDPISGSDYAIIELDRNVEDRTPLKLRQSGTISDSSSLVVIGNPSGLPTKIADEANVRDNSDLITFTANLDTYQGNSGSAVLNAKTGEVEGVLVRGEEDFVQHPNNDCQQSKKCENNECQGETVVRTATFRSFIDSDL